MKYEIFSYRFSQEILENQRYSDALHEIIDVIECIPLFYYPNKSTSNKKLDVVQQVMNAYFEKQFVLHHKWDWHPLATKIAGSGLKADFRKTFERLTIQVEVQFGNMARWYSDIFKFQTAYSQNLTHIGLSIVPTSNLAKRIDSNVVNYERAIRELPSAELSITLPILLIGIEPDDKTPIYDISQCRFGNVRKITGTGKAENIWRIIEGYDKGKSPSEIDESSPVGDIHSTFLKETTE